MTPEKAIEFLNETAKYMSNRDTVGEDKAYWANVYNAQNCHEIANEIKRLQKYEKLVQFIANDYWELSHDKIKWIYADYKKRCRKLIEEDNEDDD